MAAVWTLEDGIAERSGPQGRTGTSAASLLQSASNQLLQQQGILVHAQLSLTGVFNDALALFPLAPWWELP